MPQKRTSRMTPLQDDPWISVSDLGEFAFCPRAGVLAHEASQDDSGTERDRRAGPRHFHDIEGLKRKLNDLAATRKTIWITILITAMAAVASLYIFAPVCGCNGQTFGNACEAAQASMSIAYDGLCAG